ncbi:MAG TPA: DUF4347 domain-containing protein, partial [Burkholderiales bacterium]|nr:DUF4347 domain-containing protein [Burkholderiales bacterium]
MAAAFVFIDARVEDFELLLQDLAPDTRVVRLDAQRDGLAQIAEALAGETDLGAIHIVSHGAPGRLVVGGTALDEAGLEAHAQELAAIGQALAASGDLLLWGCDVAAGEAGAAFVDTLAQLTGADVAASTNPTGFAGLGGDWLLEARTGAIEADLAPAPAYPHLLGGEPPQIAVTGALDRAFSGDGLATADFSTNDQARGIALQADGRILVAGEGYNGGAAQEFLVARFNADGTPDTGFGDAGHAFTAFGPSPSTVAGMALQADGGILVAGSGNSTGTQDFQLVRYNDDGSLDTGFGTNGKVSTDLDGFDDVAHGVLLQADGRILVYGESFGDLALMRYNADGSNDGSFGSNGRVFTPPPGGYSAVANAAAQQADGRIVVAGAANLDGFSSDAAVARYSDTGALDPTFGSGGFVTVDFGLFGYDDMAAAVAIQDDGRILLAGKVYDYNSGTWDILLARLNADGTRDNSFGTDGRVTTGFGDFDVGFSQEEARSLLLQPDGGIVVVGEQQGDLVVLRYEADGTLDTGFGNGGVLSADFGLYDFAAGAALRPDGHVVVAGTATTDAGTDFALVDVGPRYINDQRVNEGDAYAFQVPANYFIDPEGDALTYSAQADGGALPGWLAFDAATRTLSIVSPGFTGQVTITLTASDGTGTAADDFLLTVNSAPEVGASIPDQDATEDAPFSFTFSAAAFTDPQNFDALSFTATLADDAPLPAWLALDPDTRTFTGTPLNEDVGTLFVKVTASDGLLSASQAFAITVANTNDAPMLTPAGTPDATYNGGGTLALSV